MKNNPNSDIEKIINLFSSKPMCTEDNPCGCHFGETLHIDKICFCTIVDEIKSLIEKSLLSIRESTLKSVLELECMQDEGYTNHTQNAHQLFIDGRNLLRLQFQRQIRDELRKK